MYEILLRDGAKIEAENVRPRGGGLGLWEGDTLVGEVAEGAWAAYYPASKSPKKAASKKKG